jgi:hypothetical protein
MAALLALTMALGNAGAALAAQTCTSSADPGCKGFEDTDPSSVPTASDQANQESHTTTTINTQQNSLRSPNPNKQTSLNCVYTKSGNLMESKSDTGCPQVQPA